MELYEENFTIRKVGKFDIDNIYQVYKNCEDFLSLGPVAKASKQMIIEDFKLSEDEGGTYCGIFIQDKMIGVIDFVLANYKGIPYHAYISLLMISADNRRKGLGTEVVTAVEREILKNNSIKSILANVQTNNKNAISFWRKAGYKRVSDPQVMPDTTITYELRKDAKEYKMIRLAALADAEQLFLLNEQFNGKDETILDNIKESLLNNKQEIVVVAEEGGILVGFVCIQIKKSFCYNNITAEITEVYVDEKHRRRKIASKMIAFAETYCKQIYPLHKFELLTGKENFEAQSMYQTQGYQIGEALVLVKRW